MVVTEPVITVAAIVDRDMYNYIHVHVCTMCFFILGG